jgi:uncharacterized protein (UPF0332 family)
MTPEQQALLDKANRSLQAAKLLAQAGSHDFAVSRAYYTMFYIVQALLMQKGLSFSTHSGVINAFGLNFIKTQEIPAEYHRAIISAERIRLKGDYDIDDVISVEGAEEQIVWAERFIAIGEKLLNLSDA